MLNHSVVGRYLGEVVIKVEEGVVATTKEPVFFPPQRGRVAIKNMFVSGNPSVLHLPVVVVSVIISDHYSTYFRPSICEHLERRGGNGRDRTILQCQTVIGVVTKSRDQVL